MPCFDEAGQRSYKDGHVDVLTDDTGHPLAAALWFDLTTSARPEERPEERQGWRPADDDDAARWTVLDGQLTRHHLQGPHHYLFAIGVDPAIQGRGLGSRLLSHRHQHLGSYPAYLEATSRTSRRLYHRHGYTDLGQIQLPDGPPLWRMWLPGADGRRHRRAGPDVTR
jgi:GNAT superfamily N-acetyltransferase